MHEYYLLESIKIDEFVKKIDFDFEKHNLNLLNIPIEDYEKVLHEKLSSLYN